MKQKSNLDRAMADAKAIEHILDWCERHHTFALETPDGAWYVVMWRYDGNAPILQYIGHTANTAWANLYPRSRPTYGPTPSLTPEIDQE